MEMERVDKRPEVWVSRRLLSRDCDGEYATVAYFASKARVQSVTKRFLPDGRVVKQYEVEYETPAELEDLHFGGDNKRVFVAFGQYVKYSASNIFSNYADAVKRTEEQYAELVTRRALVLPITYVEDTIADARKWSAFARKIEGYFDKENTIKHDGGLKI